MTLNVNYQDAKTLISRYYDDDRLVSMISVIIYFPHYTRESLCYTSDVRARFYIY